MKNAIFFHIAKIGNYLEIYEEMRECILTSGVLNDALIYEENFCAPELFEFPTLEAILDFSKRHADFAVLYLHSKGASRTKEERSLGIDDWRRAMMYWLVEKHLDTTQHLAVYDTVGCTFFSNPQYPAHWQGNFWWARSNYIAKLDNPRKIVIEPCSRNWVERHKAEAWIFSGSPSYFEIYNHSINPYTTRNPRSNYAK